MFIIAVFEIRKESKEYYSRKISKKGIRKDLHFRTSVLALNVSSIENTSMNIYVDIEELKSYIQ